MIPKLAELRAPGAENVPVSIAVPLNRNCRASRMRQKLAGSIVRNPPALGKVCIEVGDGGGDGKR